MSKPLWDYTIDELDMKLRLAHEDTLRFHFNLIVEWLKEEIVREKNYQVEAEKKLVENRHQEKTVYFPSTGKVVNGCYVPARKQKRLDEEALNSCILII